MNLKIIKEIDDEKLTIAQIKDICRKEIFDDDKNLNFNTDDLNKITKNIALLNQIKIGSLFSVIYGMLCLILSLNSLNNPIFFIIAFILIYLPLTITIGVACAKKVAKQERIRDNISKKIKFNSISDSLFKNLQSIQNYKGDNVHKLIKEIDTYILSNKENLNDIELQLLDLFKNNKIKDEKHIYLGQAIKSISHQKNNDNSINTKYIHQF